MKKLIIIFTFLFLLYPSLINANTCTIDGSGVSIRTGPGTNYPKISFTLKDGNSYNLVDEYKVPTEKGCDSGFWYKVKYDGELFGYVCSSYVLLDSEVKIDKYERPWTTPKKAIEGGAIFIAKDYISKGQNTSYLKKFNVNPESGRVYSHQYMANLKAPMSEASISYKAYRDSLLLNLDLEFIIPVFLNMPEYTVLSGKTYERVCKDEITDTNFENSLNEQGFPDSYKCKLRLLHDKYPNWTFKALNTNLDFNRSVSAEKGVCSINTSSSDYEKMTEADCKSYGKNNKLVNGYCNTEGNWYIANDNAVAYYLDPRNFLDENYILMFENLGYSDKYTSDIVQKVIDGTFMAEYSLIDNELYSHIFVNAGKKAGVSSVYLASLARQESGSKGSIATSGEEFEYEGVRYKGLYNFFNIGAYSSASSPIKAGLVYASGGDDSVKVGYISPQDGGLDEAIILEKLGATKVNNIITNIPLNTTTDALREKLAGYNVTFSIEGKVRTGASITISNDVNSVTYLMAIKGDVDGSGEIEATDYVRVKNKIMEVSGSELNEVQLIAADIDNDGAIMATDYVRIKNIIMGM